MNPLGERTDVLRRRPVNVRYFYLAVSDKTLHSGLSYGGLDYVRKNHKVEEIYLADLLKEKVTKVNEDVDEFMKKWRLNYNNPMWDYPEGGEPSGWECK